MGLIGNSVEGALWKFVAVAFTKLVSILLVNFFMISVVGHYINHTTRLKVKFSVVLLFMITTKNQCFLKPS